MRNQSASHSQIPDTSLDGTDQFYVYEQAERYHNTMSEPEGDESSKVLLQRPGLSLETQEAADEDELSGGGLKSSSESRLLGQADNYLNGRLAPETCCQG